MKLLFITGAPNAGKTTAAKQLHEERAVDLIVSPGAWLREHLANRDLDNESKHNDLANYISNNFSNDVLEPLVKEYVDECIDRAESENALTVLVEGYPRTKSESEHIMSLSKRFENVSVIHLNIDRELALERGTKRKRADDESGLHHRYEFWQQTVTDILAPCAAIVHEFNAANFDAAQILSLPQESLPDVDESPPPPPPCPSTFWEPANAAETATIIQMHLRLAGCSRRRRQFCGSHPVSLDRKNMPRLLRYPYLCALKIDGCRFFCAVRDSRLWFLNRKLAVWRGPFDERLAEFDDSLLDGELTLNNLFIVIDVLCMSGNNVMRRPIVERLTFAARLGQMLMHTPFHFRAQEYVHRSHLSLLLERANQMPFGTDGVIFQPEKLPARLGIDYNLFKFKNASDNTVDLLMGEDGELYCRKTSDTSENDDTLTLDVNSGILLTKVRVGRIHPDYVKAEWLKAGTVAEFSPSLDDAKSGALSWIPKRPRWDKHFPNMDWVIQNIMRSIHDNISLSELIEYTSRPPLQRSQVPSPPPHRRKGEKRG